MIHSDELTHNQYTEFLICLQKNYIKYSKDKFGYEIDGTFSLSEQMADTFGILASFKAYLNQFKLYEKDTNVKDDHKLLPGLKYDQQQLFFIRYAQSYCRKRKITNIEQFEQFHVIHEYRAFQASLIPEFSKIFNCNSSYQGILKSCKIFNID